ARAPRPTRAAAGRPRAAARRGGGPPALRPDQLVHPRTPHAGGGGVRRRPAASRVHGRAGAILGQPRPGAGVRAGPPRPDPAALRAPVLWARRAPLHRRSAGPAGAPARLLQPAAPAAAAASPALRT